MLERLMGHQARSAGDGLEALQIADEFRPNVILLDIGLPKMNGYEVARRIRERPWGRNVLLVALTGWGQADDRRKAYAAGFDQHLTKPVQPDVIERMLASLAPAQSATERV